MSKNKINKRYKTVRRVVLTCPMDKRHDALEWAYKNGYRMVRGGPKRISCSKVDLTRFKMVAEKQIPTIGG